MHKHGTFFRIFLFVYLLFLLYHAMELHWGSWLAVLGFASGIILALVAHLRHGYAMIVLLLVHMAIEWSEYGQQGATYSTRDIVFYCIHTTLDFTFLWQEVRAHLARFRYVIMGTVAIGLAAVFWYAHQQYQAILATHSSNVLETIVIGGILGCTLSHIIARKKEVT